MVRSLGQPGLDGVALFQRKNTQQDGKKVHNKGNVENNQINQNVIKIYMTRKAVNI